MAGKGRHPILGVRSIDPVLSMAAPIGLAASVGTGLVVDLVDSGQRPEGRSLSDLAREGPMVAELSPGRTGVAFIAGGGAEPDRAIDILRNLAGRWPAIVARVDGEDWPFPVVPVVPLYPGRLLRIAGAGCVWQPLAARAEAPGPGPVMPPLRASVLRRLLDGHLPRRSRWVDSWRRIWSMPWA